MGRGRVREVGDAALLLELEERIDPGVNAVAVAAAEAVRAAALPGVRDVIATYRSVAVYVDPLGVDVGAVRACLEGVDTTARVAPGPRHEVPVVYGGDAGPDLADLAARAGLSIEEAVALHAGADYRVFMVGFLPGFPYMGAVDARIAAGRHATPRLRVPAGAVGIAGRQTGIYPQDAPGGWQIIGRTPLSVFDPARARPALFAAGDTVRFVPQADAGDGPARREPVAAPTVPGRSRRRVTVLRPGLFTTVQDLGRWGHQAIGVPVSGSLDAAASRAANAAVGNPADAALLEVTLLGPELRLEQACRLAVAGADLDATVDGRAVEPGVAMSCGEGSVLRFGERRRGFRAYVAFDGGLDLPAVLGSRATHVRVGLGGLGGRALRTGDSLPLGVPAERGGGRAAVAHDGGGARLRVLPGPQEDFFPPAALDALVRTRFQVTPQSDRMGYRLSGTALERHPGREMISDATFIGAVQVPPSGEPILLLADRQTTGGYPQIAIVITADLPRAGQLGPGDWVEFERCSRADALRALAGRDD